MKELTIEEKAKAYDEALAKVVKIHRNYKERVRAVDIVIEEVFPEFQENEDEMIRKALIEYYSFNKDGSSHALDNITPKQIVAWLEKQGEKKPAFEMKTSEESLGIDSETYNKIVDECIYGEQKPADKVEPKFHEGDWITDGDKTTQIVDVGTGLYIVNRKDMSEVSLSTKYIEKWYHLWTIQDAKDGDILCTYECWGPKIVFILKGAPKKHYALSYHCYYNIMYPHFASDSEKGCLAPNDEDVKPATKEQRDLLFQKMKEAGYTFDFEKKELKKIEPKTAAWTPMDEQRVENLLAIIEGHGYPGEVAWLNSLEDRIQLKQEWNEEDKTMLQYAIEHFERQKRNCIEGGDRKKEMQEFIDWLKSLKDRVQPKQEWSEEDESMLNDIMHNIHFAETHRNVTGSSDMEKDQVNWLKSLLPKVKPQNTWKPSLSQLNALGIVAKGNPPDDIEEIKSLYNDLYKLIN